MEFSITVDSEAFKKSLVDVSAKYETAFDTALNMIASMIKIRGDADIQGAGNFSEAYTAGLKVTVDGNRIITMLDEPGAGLFETGGTIQGNPLLWIPISGTDAAGIQAKNYGGGLFSVNRKAGGVPLLFSRRDRAPKYFGIASVNIPKKFHLEEIQLDVMSNFKAVFESALNA
jgi:hypothetical protein